MQHAACLPCITKNILSKWFTWWRKEKNKRSAWVENNFSPLRSRVCLPQTSSFSKHSADGVIIKQNKHSRGACVFSTLRKQGLSAMCEQCAVRRLIPFDPEELVAASCNLIHTCQHIAPHFISLHLPQPQTAFSSPCVICCFFSLFS